MSMAILAFRIHSSNPPFSPVRFPLQLFRPSSHPPSLLVVIMAAIALARAIHQANVKKVEDAVLKLKEARAAAKASGDNLMKEKKKEEVAKVKSLMGPSKLVKPVKAVSGVKKTVKPMLCKPFVPVKQGPGRPSDGSCNACKRLLAGKKGGKPHICGRVRYSRLGLTRRL